MVAKTNGITNGMTNGENYNDLATPKANQQSPKIDVVGMVTAFLSKMEAAISSKQIEAIVDLFHEHGWWRDILTIDMDMNSLCKGKIEETLKQFGVPEITNLKVVDAADATTFEIKDEVAWIQAFLSFETPTARGQGFVRLQESSPGKGDWMAFTFFTALWEIKGHEEFAFHRRPKGAVHGEHANRKNWLDRRRDAVKFEEEDPTVLIVGGGQNGLMLGARLSALGIPTLIVEKNPRIGDSWRNRYYSLCLHDPIWADEFPYLPFPPQWPIYTPKDKIANWMEHYAEIMELNVVLRSTIQRNPTFDVETRKWKVVLETAGKEPRTMHVSRLVLASGFSGEARLPAFPQSEFQGTAVHSSLHRGAQGWEGRKAVVVGCCNSGHDIAADFYERGVDVTIVQRSSTYVMSSKYGIPGLLNGFYEEGGPTTAHADLMFSSIPIDLLAQFHVEATKEIAKKDKPMLDALRKVGFKTNDYAPGLFVKYFRDGGGYYIDVGASALIAEQKIKLKQGHEIVKLTNDGVLFDDGEELKADIVVFATGYSSMRETVRRVISDDVANRIGPCWGKDGQGEIPGVWRHSGVDNFTLMCGNMVQARIFSKHAALQIQMEELGLKKAVYPKYKEVLDSRF